MVKCSNKVLTTICDWHTPDTLDNIAIWYTQDILTYMWNSRISWEWCCDDIRWLWHRSMWCDLRVKHLKKANPKRTPYLHVFSHWKSVFTIFRRDAEKGKSPIILLEFLYYILPLCCHVFTSVYYLINPYMMCFSASYHPLCYTILQWYMYSR